MQFTKDHIEVAARVLRERQQAGKKLNDWDDLPNSTKNKWIGHAEAMLSAVASVRSTEL